MVKKETDALQDRWGSDKPGQFAKNNSQELPRGQEEQKDDEREASKGQGRTAAEKNERHEKPEQDPGSAADDGGKRTESDEDKVHERIEHTGEPEAEETGVTVSELNLDAEKEELREGAEGEELPREELRARITELQTELEDKEKKLEEYQKLLDEYEERVKKIQAEFVSYKHRMERERIRTAEKAERELIESLLPVLDNFERAITASEEARENEALASGVKMVFRQLYDLLEDKGLKPIPAEGEKFDPNVHEAVMQIEDDHYESEQIVEELEKGYKYGDKVIRAAKVKVAK